jgi:hypothetical protein
VLAYLRDQGVSLATIFRGSTEAVSEGYSRYLTEERGLAGITARTYVELIRPFLKMSVAPGK